MAFSENLPRRHLARVLRNEMLMEVPRAIERNKHQYEYQRSKFINNLDYIIKNIRKMKELKIKLKKQYLLITRRSDL